MIAPDSHCLPNGWTRSYPWNSLMLQFSAKLKKKYHFKNIYLNVNFKTDYCIFKSMLQINLETEMKEALTGNRLIYAFLHVMHHIVECFFYKNVCVEPNNQANMSLDYFF